MANWIKFNGSDEHKRIIRQQWNNNTYLVKLFDGKEYKSGTHKYDEIDYFMICEPHPHREMIIEWANTGRPVYKKTNIGWVIDNTPIWYGKVEYSFDPPKEKIRYRVALMKGYRVEAYSEEAASMVLHSDDFVKWLTDWLEVEINE